MTFKESFKGRLDDLKSNKRLKIYIGAAVAIVVIVIAGFAVVKLSHHETKEESAIQTFVVPENEKIFINGSIVPKQTRLIPAPAGDIVPDIRVTDGATVQKGDTLYILKDDNVLNEITSVKNQINSLMNERRSLQSNDPALISLNSQIVTLNSSLSALNAKAYTKVKAPIDGRVYMNDNQTSQQASTTLMTIQSKEYVLNGQVSERDLSKLKKDMTADITILSNGTTLKGRISEISDFPAGGPVGTDATQAGGSSGGAQLSYYDITITLDTQEGIVAGYHAQASIDINSDKHTIPTSAIINSGNDVYVFVDVDGILTKVNVEIINENENYSVVTGNLNESDIIIKNPTHSMKDGDPVNISGDKDAKDSGKKESDK